MRYWLLRRPPHYGEIHPNSTTTPWDYDKVFVNPRLKPGDIVYLIAAYNELYGWGHVEKKQSYQDNELKGRAYKITVTRPVVQILTSREEVKNIPELAPLFKTSVNLVELNAGQVTLLSGLLASKGVITPPDMFADKVPKPTPSIQDFPRVELSSEVRIWLGAAYDRLKAGKKVDPQEMVVELWPQIPDFDYQSIDKRLMRFGVELTLLGILQIDPTTELVTETDRVIRFVKERIQNEPGIEKITSEEVSETLEIREEGIAQIFGLMDHLGDFWNGAGGNGNMPGYATITIKDEHVKREYLKYQRLEPLLERFYRTGQQEPSSGDTPPNEPHFFHNLLDGKFGERLEVALDSIDALPADDVLNYDTERLTKTVERFAISPPTVRTDKVGRDEKTIELEDLTVDRKTGHTGHCFLIPIEGEAEWLQEIDSQIAAIDNHPIAFLDKNRGWIYIKLTISLDDPEGTLKLRLDQRLTLIEEYAAFVTERIIGFNKELAEEMTEDLNKRKNAIQKAKNEAESLGLPKMHNPKHDETKIQIDVLMQGLNGRLTRPLTHAEQLYEEVKALIDRVTPLDLETAKLVILIADDAIEGFGNTNQRKRLQLSEWKARAESELPPETFKDLRERTERGGLAKAWRRPLIKKALIGAVALTFISGGLGGLLGLKRLLSSDKQSTPPTPHPSPSATAEQKGFDYWTREKTIKGITPRVYRWWFPTLDACQRAESDDQDKDRQLIGYGCSEDNPGLDVLKKQCEIDKRDTPCKIKDKLEADKRK